MYVVKYEFKKMNLYVCLYVFEFMQMFKQV
jgi:hypothetical protein